MTNKKMTSMVPVVLLTFVNTIGFAIMIPVFPFVVERYGSGALMYGFLLSSYSVFQYIGAPILGALSDKYGRRPLLMISHGGTLLSWAIFAIAYFVPSVPLATIALPIWIILFSRMVDGITGGNMSVVHAYVADITHDDKKTRAFGRLGATLGVGLLIGPAIGGFSSAFEIEYLGTVITAFFISLITLILMYFYLPESLEDEHRVKVLEKDFWKQINVWKRMKKYKNNHYLNDLFLLRVFFGFTFACYTTIVVLFAKEAFNLTPEMLGMLFFFIGSFVIFNQGVVVHRIAKHIGDHRAFHLGIGIMAVGLCLFLIKPNLWLYLIFAYIVNLGFSISMPTLRTLMAISVNKSQQGEVTGIDGSLQAASVAVAPIVASTIYLHSDNLAFALFALFLAIPYLYFGFARLVGARERV